MPSFTARLAAGLVTSFSVLFLASCGSTHSDQAHPTSTSDKPVITGEPAGYNGVDVAFADNLVPHEEQGIKLAQLATGHSSNTEIAAFAAKAAAAYQVDTDVLKALRAQWKESPNSHAGDGGSGMTTSFTVDDATLAKLDSLQGPDFDTQWLQSMLRLDHGAIDMANAEIAGGKNRDAIGLAKQVLKARQAEIGQIQQLQQTGAD